MPRRGQHFNVDHLSYLARWCSGTRVILLTGHGGYAIVEHDCDQVAAVLSIKQQLMPV